MSDNDRDLTLSRMLEQFAGEPDNDARLERLSEDDALRAEPAELVEIDRLLRHASFLEAERPDLVAGVLARQRCLDRNSPRFGAKVISRVKRERRRRRPPILAALAAAAAVITTVALVRRVPEPIVPIEVAAPVERVEPAERPASVLVAEVGQAAPGARLVRGGGASSLAAGTALCADDCIQTASSRDPNAEDVTIIFADRTEVRLSSATRMSFAPGPAVSTEGHAYAKQLERTAGVLTASVTKQPPGLPMTIVTPHASVSVIGTSFWLSAATDATSLEVDAGAVQIARLSDGVSAVVKAGFGAVAGTGIDLVAAPLAGPVLFERDFEDGRMEAEWVGTIQDTPPREGSRHAMAGVSVHNGRHTEVNLVNRATGVFVHRKGAMLTFDYWVAQRVRAIDVILWDRTRQLSLSGESLFDLRKEAWTYQNGKGRGQRNSRKCR